MIEEAVATTRSVPLTSELDIDDFVETLDSYQHSLYKVGRRADAFEVCADLATWSRRHSRRRASPAGCMARCLAEAGQRSEAAVVCGTSSATQPGLIRPGR